MRFHQTCYICNISKVHLQHLFEIKYTTWILQQVPFSRVFIMAGICNSHKRSNLRLFAVIFTNQSKQNAPHLEINHFFWHAWLLIALLIFFNYIYINVWRVWHALLKRHWNKSKLDVIWCKYCIGIKYVDPYCVRHVHYCCRIIKYCIGSGILPMIVVPIKAGLVGILIYTQYIRRLRQSIIFIKTYRWYNFT